MSIILQSSFNGSGVIGSPFVKAAGADASESGGVLAPADLTIRTVYKVDLSAATLPAVVEIDGFLTDSGGFEVLVILSWQSDNKKYVGYMSSSGFQFFLHTGTDFSTNYTLLTGGSTTFALLNAPGLFRLRVTHQADNTLRADLWNASLPENLGSGGWAVISNFVCPNTSPQITAAGKAGVGMQRSVLRDFTFSDAAVTSDTTPPTLSSFTATGGALTGNGSITTDEAGTLWVKADASATATDPGSGAENLAGWSSKSMAAPGVQTFNFGTLTAGGKYGHAFAVDAAGNRSSVSNTSVFVVTGSGDTEAPVLTGTIAITSLTPTGYTATCPAGTDNVGVTGYQWRLGGSGSWTEIGTPTFTFTGRSPGTTDALEMRCRDAAGNFSAALTASINLPSVADTTPPVMTGSVGAGAVGSTTASISWQAGTDNIGIVGYEYSLNGGAYVVGNSLTTRDLSGLIPLTAYTVTVRAFDAAGNRSAVITGSFTTTSAAPGPSTGTNLAGPFFNNTLNEPYREVSVSYSWWPGAGQRIGSLTGTPTQGAVLLDANGYCAPTSGRGLLMVCIPRTDARDDFVSYHAF